MNFIAAVGGERRAPRRAAASAARYSYCSSSSASPAPPSSKDKERSFDSKVAESRKKGVWGGAEEIQAFCQSYKRDVNVYTMYGIQNFRDVHASDDEEREAVHIAFHVGYLPCFTQYHFSNLCRISTIIPLYVIQKAHTQACRVYPELNRQSTKKRQRLDPLS